MYFPYLRGRQYELIALRELLSNKLLDENILPIIEPIKLSSTLFSTLEAFTKEEKKISVIINPEVGHIGDHKNDSKEFLEIFRNDKILKSYILKKNSNKELSEFKKSGLDLNNLILIKNNKDNHSELKEINEISNLKYFLIPDNDRINRRNTKVPKVIFVDNFNKRNRNSDYNKDVDEFFSDDHLFYEEEGFVGFADYSIIGKEYFDSGFAPYAVAIHLVYLDKDKSLRIIHFVSDSNTGIEDPAGKFYEALQKLNKWSSKKKLYKTNGLNTLLDHYSKGTYPGLGTVKKLTLMHHLETIGYFFKEVK